jgi:DNA-binding response OmpR family regulator
MRILIVDSDRDVLEMICVLLERPGAFVYPVASCRRAKEILSESDFDWVLVENNLSDGDGLDILRIIREYCLPTRVLALSCGAPDDELSRRSAKLGAAGIIFKPFNTDRLEGIIFGGINSRTSGEQPTGYML